MIFTKTQTALLDLIARKGRIHVSRYVGRGANGAVISGGIREAEAALELERLGYLTRVSFNMNQETKGGYAIRYADYEFTAPSAVAHGAA